MTPHRPLHLAVALDGPARYDAGHYVDLAVLAERGALDFVTLGDSFARPGPDALAVLARLAPATHRIGLVPTVTTTYTEPVQVATALATLDWVSGGRAGWVIGVSATQAEAGLFGRGAAPATAALWREAGRVADTAGRLWDGWADGPGAAGTGRRAIRAPGSARAHDTGRHTTGRHTTGCHGTERQGTERQGTERQGTGTDRPVDESGLRHVDFRGPCSAARGPVTVPGPPQGRPVTVVDISGTRDEGRRTAARYADVVLVRATSPEQAAALRSRIHRDAGALGRDPRELRVLQSLPVDLGEREQGAEPGLTGPYGRDGGPRLAARGTYYSGGPVDLAELITRWHRGGAVDGFHLAPIAPQRDLERIVNGTVALLQHRSLFRVFHPGGTLREHLGLARPMNRYAGAARSTS
ncbi:LLM class flavin-dependent oxidoreductase [Streptomyces sp. NPDC051018]|uniref:LLM class flavin-dependent oxidoreductase n=1 Tax=Streptomyces sp. NPDC051018 TaxID=3365639 RepID=UPI0037A711BF